MLYERELCKVFPVEVLRLLDFVVDPESLPSDLKQCLDVIIQVKPDLAKEPIYKKLRTFVRE